MIFVYTTCKNIEEAKKLGKIIVEKKLAGCVNIWPIESTYWWDGKVVDDNEAVLFIKTLEQKVHHIEELIAQNHSYSTPCIATIQVFRINQPYKEWLSKCL